MIPVHIFNKARIKLPLVLCHEFIKIENLIIAYHLFYNFLLLFLNLSNEKYL